MKEEKNLKLIKEKDLYDLEGGLIVVTGPYALPQMIANWMVSLFVK